MLYCLELYGTCLISQTLCDRTQTSMEWLGSMGLSEIPIFCSIHFVKPTVALFVKYIVLYIFNKTWLFSLPIGSRGHDVPNIKKHHHLAWRRGCVRITWRHAEAWRKIHLFQEGQCKSKFWILQHQQSIKMSFNLSLNCNQDWLLIIPVVRCPSYGRFFECAGGALADFFWPTKTGT